MKTKGVRIFGLGIAIFLSINILASYASETKIGSPAEWLLARKVLMHTPEDEIFWGVIHPAAALYEKPFSLQKAALEHRRFIEGLRNAGVTVYTVVETLLKGTTDENGNTIAGNELNELRNFAKQFLTIDRSRLHKAMQFAQGKYKEETITGLSPKELVRIILLQPTLHLYPTRTNTGFRATYELSPVMNLYFCRDQMITTARGVVIGKMNSPQRAVETQIMKFVLMKLGITPIYEVVGPGRLEGGDYFSADDVAFIGQGLRTNSEGIRQLLRNKVFGLPKVAVVKDSWRTQEEMHLDTYFNIIGPKLAVLVDLRMNPRVNPSAGGINTRVDLYELRDGAYRLKMKDRDFQEFLERDLGYKLIPVSREDQNLYGINFLTLRANKIFAIDGVSEKYKELLKENHIDVSWMDFSALTGGYGAAHCTTQVLYRETETAEISRDSN